MIVAVTGGTGFLGRRVVAHLQARGHQVRVLTRQDGGLGDRDALRRLCAGADYMIHMASVGVQARHRVMGDMVAVNVRGTVHVMEAVLENGVAGMTMTGTVLEYQGSERPIRESAVTDPADPYGATKSAGGLLARAMAAGAGHRLVYLRLASMLGPGDDSDKLVPQVVRALAAGKPVDLTPGAQEREWLHVDDGADAVIKSLDLREAAVVNIGTGVGYSVRSFLERLCEALGADSSLLRFGAKPARAGEPARLVMDVSKARSLMGWQSARTVDDIVAELSSSVKG